MDDLRSITAPAQPKLSDLQSDLAPPKQTPDQIKAAAASLAGYGPDDLLGFSIKKDGSVAIIIPTGQKYVYSQEQILESIDKLLVKLEDIVEEIVKPIGQPKKRRSK